MGKYYGVLFFDEGLFDDKVFWVVYIVFGEVYVIE